MQQTQITIDTAPTTGDWRLQIPEHRRRPMRAWFWSIAAMTLSVLIVGGITRLTQSGLSITDWQPLMGVVPPLTDAQWQDKFDLYRQYPEYQLLRRGMSLEEFKFIFFWEYLHRLLARAIGIVFLIPFIFFAVRGWMNRPLATRALVLFGLGGAQGVMGWVMVQSGLSDTPSVSHYRLAAHLSLAFIIFGMAVWLARDLKAGAGPGAELPRETRRSLTRGVGLVGVLLAVQVVWGAFVAGMKAGKFYNTFPLMGGRLVPRELTALEPAWTNFLANAVTVQWLHRVLGTLLTLAVIWLFFETRRVAADATSSRYASSLLGLTLAQYALGVATLVYAVPVSLGVIHQAVAMVLFGIWTIWLHHLRSVPLKALPTTT
jgi:heme a synthase